MLIYIYIYIQYHIRIDSTFVHIYHIELHNIRSVRTFFRMYYIYIYYMIIYVGWGSLHSMLLLFLLIFSEHENEGCRSIATKYCR